MFKSFFPLILFVFPVFSQSVIITEIMQDPVSVSDTNGEYFELYNTSGAVIDLQGWTIRSAGNGDHVVDNGGPLTIAVGGYLVIGRNADTLSNGGTPVDYAFSFGLNNTSDYIALLDTGLTLIDSVAYDNGATFPDPSGASMIYNGNEEDDNNDGSKWVAATAREPNFKTGLGTDFGSPGTGPFNDSPLPVELKSFRAIAGDSKVTLKWYTGSEINNLGFEIFRSLDENNHYIRISSYLDNKNLKGSGSASVERHYLFTDYDVTNGNRYWYKLVDISSDGERKEHTPVQAIPKNADEEVLFEAFPESYRLHQNYPNPFNPETTIRFEIPKLKTTEISVALNIFNMSGQKIKTLFDGPLNEGVYTFIWNGTDFKNKRVSSGIYIYRIESQDFIQSNRMVFLK